MELISLQSQEEKLSFKELFSVKGAVRNITAISAYIDIESIVQLIGFLSNSADSRGKPSLRIYIDKSSSRFFSDRKTRNELLDQQKIIQNKFSQQSGIFLVQFGKLFHSKIYLIEGNRYGKIILGSLNLTQKGISENEEILLVDNYEIKSRSISSKLSKWVKEYSEALELKSVSVANNNDGGNYPSCMRQFLLNGTIYYELKEQSPFRIKLHLPEKLIKQQAEIDPMLESSVTDTISVETLISEPINGLNIKLPSLGSTRAYWKKYCVETCYGHWNPDLWNDELVSTLEKRIEQRKPYYDKVISIIKERAEEVESSFIGLCTRIQEYLITRGVSDWKYGELDKATEAWRKWHTNLLAKVDNEKFYNRLISGISSVPSPDVWSDPLSSREFEDSFFKSILYHWSKEYSKETTNVIAQAIAWNMDFGAEEKNEMDVIQLKESIDNWLSENPEASIVDFNEEE